jgi:hypothetical protein
MKGRECQSENKHFAVSTLCGNSPVSIQLNFMAPDALVQSGKVFVQHQTVLHRDMLD